MNNRSASGFLELEAASVGWRLSIDRKKEARRRFKIDADIDLELSDGFNNLHVKSYQEILAGNGFGIDDAREAVRICEMMRK
jgi:UDP-N-acetyl-2-amino-2-deoxyglucuronate dehydrogenase